MEQINSKTILSAEDVRERYGINIEAVKALAREKKLPCIRAGQRYVFPLAALEAYEEELGRRCAENASKANGAAPEALYKY